MRRLRLWEISRERWKPCRGNGKRRRRANCAGHRRSFSQWCTPWCPGVNNFFILLIQKPGPVTWKQMASQRARWVCFLYARNAGQPRLLIFVVAMRRKEPVSFEDDCSFLVPIVLRTEEGGRHGGRSTTAQRSSGGIEFVRRRMKCHVR